MSLYEQIWSWSNLLLAYRRASRGKRSRGAVATFEHRLEDNLLELQRTLQQGTYRPGLYRSFLIHEPKRRLISAAPFLDRVVHHALCAVLEQVWETPFIYDSYANRLGKGTHRALDRLQGFARRYRYALQCDVQQFFPSIDHEVLKKLLYTKIVDAHVRCLIEQILESSVGILDKEYSMVYFPGDDLFAACRPRGLPIGNLTSQLWANCYLNSFDHFVKRELRCPGYVRYVDDFVLFGHEKQQMWQWKYAIQQRLGHLRLTMHDDAHPRPVTEGIPFLGFVVYPEHRRLKRRKGMYFQRKLRTQLEACRKEEWARRHLQALVQGWVNHVRYGNTVGLRNKLLTNVDPVIISSISTRGIRHGRSDHINRGSVSGRGGGGRKRSGVPRGKRCI